MIMEPHCFKRRCKHYLGILQPDRSEGSEVPYCEAFPKGIPEEIAYGDNEHDEPLADQENDIVFEKE